MKSLTFEDCEKKYAIADKTFRRYLDQTIKIKFGEYRLAAKAIQRSRAHVNDCLTGKRGIDSVRRLVLKIETVKAEL